jgi:hypothetical protein
MAEQSVRPKIRSVLPDEDRIVQVSRHYMDKTLAHETAFGLFLEKVREWKVLDRKEHFTRSELASDAMTAWIGMIKEERQVFVNASERSYPSLATICQVGHCAERRYSILHTLSETKDQCRRYENAFFACQHLLNDKENQILYLKQQLQAYESRFEDMKSLFESRPVTEEYRSQV